MVDVLTPKQRQYCMSRIQGKNTKPEVLLRKALWWQGYRYRINYNLPGRPDIVFIKRGIVVFVDGCFWHMCPEHFIMPKTNQEFWKAKLKGNVARDRKVARILNQQGWQVIRVWEHEIASDIDQCIAKLEKNLRQ